MDKAEFCDLLQNLIYNPDDSKLDHSECRVICQILLLGSDEILLPKKDSIRAILWGLARYKYFNHFQRVLMAKIIEKWIDEDEIQRKVDPEIDNLF